MSDPLFLVVEAGDIFLGKSKVKFGDVFWFEKIILK
jgi:hypothetical protein